MRLVYLIGPPGVGKSTIMAELTDGLRRMSLRPPRAPFAMDVLYRDRVDTAIELGARRESFSGTDALGMSVNPLAVEWVGTRPHRLLLGEGARLANRKFLLAARDSGYIVTVVALSAPERVLRARRTERGSQQNEAWVKGATTRAQRLSDGIRLDLDVLDVSADQPVKDVVGEIQDRIPELATLGGPR